MIIRCPYGPKDDAFWKTRPHPFSNLFEYGGRSGSFDDDLPWYFSNSAPPASASSVIASCKRYSRAAWSRRPVAHTITLRTLCIREFGAGRWGFFFFLFDSIFGMPSHYCVSPLSNPRVNSSTVHACKIWTLYLKPVLNLSYVRLTGAVLRRVTLSTCVIDCFLWSGGYNFIGVITNHEIKKKKKMIRSRPWLVQHDWYSENIQRIRAFREYVILR